MVPILPLKARRRSYALVLDLFVSEFLCRDLHELANYAHQVVSMIPSFKTDSCPWGGREPGKPNKATEAKVGVVRELHGQGKPIAEIARVVGLTRQTVYRLLANIPPKTAP